MPASRADRIPEHTRACLLHTSSPPAGIGRRTSLLVARMLSEVRDRRPTCADLLVEVLVLLQMIRKRVRRRQHFSAYGEWVLARDAVRDLVKTSLTPTSTYRGWYRLEEELSATPIGKACQRALRELTTTPPPTTDADLTAALDCCLLVADLATPATVEDLQRAIDCYRTYLELT